MNLYDIAIILMFRHDRKKMHDHYGNTNVNFVCWKQENLIIKEEDI